MSASSRAKAVVRRRARTRKAKAKARARTRLAKSTNQLNHLRGIRVSPSLKPKLRLKQTPKLERIS